MYVRCAPSPHASLIIAQGPTVQGKVSLTCDAWQVGNTDGYFVATAHWVEESTPAKWELKNAIIGFVQLNNAHNGEQLGQALFRIIKHVAIKHKVSHLSMVHCTVKLRRSQQMLATLPAVMQATIQL